MEEEKTTSTSPDIPADVRLRKAQDDNILLEAEIQRLKKEIEQHEKREDNLNKWWQEDAEALRNLKTTIRAMSVVFSQLAQS